MIDQYAPLLFTYIFRLTSDRPLSHELVQDVFLKIWLARENLGRVRQFRVYLFIISRNHAVNAVKKAIRQKRYHQEWEKFTSAGNGEEPDNEFKFTLIDEAISRLPPQQHKVWTMSRLQGLRHREIASRLNLSIETVKKYLQHAFTSILRYVEERIPLLFICMAIASKIIL